MKNKLAVQILAPRVPKSLDEDHLLDKIKGKYGSDAHKEIRDWLDECRVWYHLERNYREPTIKAVITYRGKVKSSATNLIRFLKDTQKWAALISRVPTSTPLPDRTELLRELSTLVDGIETNAKRNKTINRGRTRSARGAEMLNLLRGIFHKYDIPFKATKSSLAVTALGVGLKQSNEAASKAIERSASTK